MKSASERSMAYQERLAEKGHKLLTLWLSPSETLKLDLLASALQKSRPQVVRDLIEEKTA